VDAVVDSAMGSGMMGQLMDTEEMMAAIGLRTYNRALWLLLSPCESRRRWRQGRSDYAAMTSDHLFRTASPHCCQATSRLKTPTCMLPGSHSDGAVLAAGVTWHMQEQIAGSTHSSCLPRHPESRTQQDNSPSADAPPGRMSGVLPSPEH
jgi:hypothetical protein